MMLLQCIEDMLVRVKGDPDDSVYVLEGEIVEAKEVKNSEGSHSLCIEVSPNIEVTMRKKDAFEHFTIIEH